ncbi:hypothetical protein DYBT9623_04985 [Dyadobacter sp. CECT 9623]|jgi:hypothetical protein|uniref:Uncharacterized protein n=1 Tax=Dyadobacter linearis TaxID=2823330 RepID=A0ABN7RJP4_9BACT|nr:hypothetical protein [Dyadobacter sp. CECT 9623]CAG5074210.1 hypothetical protein DYBT9623_04985 [Dyadobacter sp. CECT 9623]
MHYLISYKSTNWDSVLLPLDDNTLQLTIQVRVHLRKVEPTDRGIFDDLIIDGKGTITDRSSGYKYQANPWTMAEWQDFENEYQKVITNYWDKKFDLVPNRPWYKSSKGLTPAKIVCGLSMDIVKTSPAQAHVALSIFNTRKKPNTFRSFINTTAVPKTGCFNRSDVETDMFSWMPHRYRSESAVSRINGVAHAVDYVRNTAAHEFGHILELDHVGGTGNDMRDYGFNNVDDADTLLGVGRAQSAKFAKPWNQRLRGHLIRQNHEDQLVNFTPTLSTPQMIGYWDNGELIHVGGNLWMLKSLFGL